MDDSEASTSAMDATNSSRDQHLDCNDDTDEDDLNMLKEDWPTPVMPEPCPIPWWWWEYVTPSEREKLKQRLFMEQEKQEKQRLKQEKQWQLFKQVDLNCKVVQQTLSEATNILSENLLPGKVLRSMKTEMALDPDDVEGIRNQDTRTEQVERMTEVLMKKPVSAYKSFMEILKEERQDLYKKVMIIQEKHSKKLIEDQGEQSQSIKESGSRKTVKPEEHVLKRKLAPNATARKRSRECPRNAPEKEPEVLSDSDIKDVVKVLRQAELKRLCNELGVSVEKEIYAKAYLYLDDEEHAFLILQYWRQINGGKATRQRILEALKKCDLEYQAYVLKTMWGVKTEAHETGPYDTGQIGLTTYFPSNANTPTVARILSDNDIHDVVKKIHVTDYDQLFQELGLTPKHREAAKKYLDPERHATLVLMQWRQVNGGEATTQRVLDVLESANLKYAALVLGKKWANES